MLLGRGVQVPMLVIFTGSIGGFLSSGIIGLFTGAVVLTLGYMLFTTWLRGEDAEPVAQATDDAPARV
jgi:predicted PurR-regulated permease PerM